MLIIIPTVDVEGVHGQPPFERMVMGKSGSGSYFGIQKIADIFLEFGVKGTFFLDVYEHTLYGEKPLREACESILRRNQDVELHTHPAWRDDKRDFLWLRKLKQKKSFFSQEKDFMFKCTLDEQIHILEHGIECLRQWCGENPIAHRAGGYGINKDTIKALDRVKIPIDSSIFYGHPNCKVNWAANQIDSQTGIVEIPITGFTRYEEIALGPKNWIRERPFIKTDLDGCSLKDLLWFVKQATQYDIRIMTLFMHSYSLLRFDRRFRFFKYDYCNAEKLKRFLRETLNDKNIVYMSMDQFWLQWKKSGRKLIGKDGIPKRHIKSSAFSLAVKKFRQIVKLPPRKN